VEGEVPTAVFHSNFPPTLTHPRKGGGDIIEKSNRIYMKKEKKKSRKNHVISTRISGDELQLLEMKSRSSNKSISDLMREALQSIAPPGTSSPNS
jgi:hypothetical protein